MQATVLVLGAGRMGAVAARELARLPEVARVLVADAKSETCRAAARAVGEKAQPIPLPAAFLDGSLPEVASGVDAVVSCLPHGASWQAFRAAAAGGWRLVDLACDRPRERLGLQERAVRSGAVLVAGMGLAPGLSNVLVGRGCRVVPRPREAVIRVGGIPRQPRPPLGYHIVFCLESVLEACVRPAWVIRDGQLRRVEALSDVEEIEYPQPLGRCECFITDGLGTLPFTLGHRGLWRMEEKTVRYRGYRERMAFLREAGFLGQDEVEVDGVRVRPRAVTERLLEPRLRGDDEDLVVLEVMVSGDGAEDKPRARYFLLDEYDARTCTTAMARTTVYPAVEVVRWILAGELTEPGVWTPERLIGENPERFQRLVRALEERGIEIHIQEPTVPWPAGVF